ncbi:hypothetical protein L596_000850 [Steinernema carpocapsae]|uniref:Uncharacterized protein n=1 Tax=Steinernema carpocapsae TaxID=34508 RepID=A0A4V6YST1_STECR|nr:hypothetical protein L596_000850 [Steinernema carpocapsae]
MRLCSLERSLKEGRSGRAVSRRSRSVGHLSESLSTLPLGNVAHPGAPGVIIAAQSAAPGVVFSAAFSPSSLAAPLQLLDAAPPRTSLLRRLLQPCSQELQESSLSPSLTRRGEAAEVGAKHLLLRKGKTETRLGGSGILLGRGGQATEEGREALLP